jgi:hypothetical protein
MLQVHGVGKAKIKLHEFHSAQMPTRSKVTKEDGDVRRLVTPVARYR